MSGMTRSEVSRCLGVQLDQAEHWLRYARALGDDGRSHAMLQQLNRATDALDQFSRLLEAFEGEHTPLVEHRVQTSRKMRGQIAEARLAAAPVLDDPVYAALRKIDRITTDLVAGVTPDSQVASQIEDLARLAEAVHEASIAHQAVSRS